ncbi:hypothetical protein DWX22_03425 [Coprococcus sp. AF18-48]|nr:hypothetical protein DWX22_03425 [Coprococcus sp. AF18-48]
MALELVTGYWGMEHVTAEQDADLNAGIIGSGNYVLNIGEKMRAEAVSANQVRIFDGVFMAYGRQCILGDGEYEDVTIENGTPGLVRNDMIVVKYKKDEESGKENATFAVLKGETGSVAKDPVPNRQDIRSGAFESEVPMYRVKINGLAIEKIEALFGITMTNDDLSKKASDLDTKVKNMSSALGKFAFWDDVISPEEGSKSLTMKKSMRKDHMYLVFFRRLYGSENAYPPYAYLLFIRTNEWTKTVIGTESDVVSREINDGKLTVTFKDTQWTRMTVYEVM